MNWRIIIHPKLSPAENMAIDEAIMLGLIEGTSQPTIRFYDWQPSSLSYGFHQEVQKEIDFAALKRFGFGYVRRPTGGRMVLHDNEITYSVIAPTRDRLAGNIQNSYAEISNALATGLQMIGIEVEYEKGSLSSDQQRQEVNPCFGSSSRFELNYRKQKIVGSAQLRKKNILLQHGSILLNNDQSKIAYIMPLEDKKKQELLAKFLQKKTIAINQILEKKIDYFDAVKLLIEGFRKNWSECIFSKANGISKSERKTADNLIKTKYLSDDWNKRK